MLEKDRRFDSLPYADNKLSGKIAGLGNREHEVVECIVRGGARSRVIAAMLEISPKTADQYVLRILKVLNVSDRAQVVLAVLRMGLLDYPNGNQETKTPEVDSKA